jgi:DNA-binding FadR family transcriptional regulator
MGYVRSSLGRGTFVVDPTERWRSQHVIEEWLRSHQAAFHDLVELRAALESQSVRGSTGDPRQLARSLRPLIDAQVAAIAAGKPDDAAEMDQTFHLQIAAGSPNQPLRDMCRALIMRSRQAAQAVYRVSAYQEGSVRQHRAIVSALGRGDRDKAADLIAEHHLSRSEQVASFLERRTRDG